MAGVALKISKFFGEAPKISAELLPETVAQFAFNTKLSSGDLVPYRVPAATATLDKPGIINSIYPMDDGVGGLKWLHWVEDVDVATAQIQNDTTQRIYYTDGTAPKATNYAMATSGTMFPTTSFTLGLPYPVTAPTATAVGFSQVVAASRARDAANIATITTSVAHNLNTGNFVTLSSFGGTGYNQTNVSITVITSTTFSFFNYGTTEATATDTAGRIDLAGTSVPRTYVYTWNTLWGEESAPSLVSNTVFTKEGQTVNITALPSTWPSGTGYQTTGMTVKIYRTIATSSGTAYYFLGSVALGTTTFTDNFVVSTLTTKITTTDYDPPNAAMVGMLSIHNGMLVGFFGNTVCFSEPSKPWAWPIKYRQQTDDTIVAISNVGNTIVVATTGRLWVMQGNSPANISRTKTDFNLPCISKRSMVNLGYGVAWSTPGGLAVYGQQTAGEYLTKYVHSWDTWQTTQDIYSLVGAYYQGMYFGSSAMHSFIFEKNDQVGGYLVQSDISFTAARYRARSDAFYYVNKISGASVVYRWDDPASVNSVVDWKSKVFVFKDFCNLGAARVVADYDATGTGAQIAAANAAILVANQALITAGNRMGALGTEYFAGMPTAEPLTPLIPSSAYVQFQLYANKALVFSNIVGSGVTFRLPTGYRTDTYEVRISTNLRVRAIQIAETPTGLKNA